MSQKNLTWGKWVILALVGPKLLQLHILESALKISLKFCSIIKVNRRQKLQERHVQKNVA